MHISTLCFVKCSKPHRKVKILMFVNNDIARAADTPTGPVDVPMWTELLHTHRV